MVQTLERLPMTMGYFRLIHRCFGSGGKSAALLEGTGVSERDLANPSAEISLFQQVRQVENVSALHGTGWALSQPELWSTSAHGAIASAMLAAPTIADSIDVLRRYGHVRAPFFHMRVKPKRDTVVLEYDLTVALSEAQWRPMMEIAFVAAPKPDYAQSVRAALSEHVEYDSAINKVVLPKDWMEISSTAADSALYRNALSELQSALSRLDDPLDLRATVDLLLQT